MLEQESDTLHFCIPFSYISHILEITLVASAMSQADMDYQLAKRLQAEEDAYSARSIDTRDENNSLGTTRNDLGASASHTLKTSSAKKSNIPDSGRSGMI